MLFTTEADEVAGLDPLCVLLVLELELELDELVVPDLLPDVAVLVSLTALELLLELDLLPLCEEDDDVDEV
jgi:hypothetical protein